MEVKKRSWALTSILNEESLAQADNRHLKIAYNKLIPHEKNHYEMSDIEKMAATIEQFGVMQPLMVKPIPETDTYRIVSGHRRHAGVILLVEQEGLDAFREVPCYILDEGEDETLTEIKLHISNTTARELSEHDKMVAIMELKRLIQQAKKRDISIKGKMRDLIAETMHLGTTQVQKYLSIGEQASGEIKDALHAGEITVQEAYETTRRPSKEFCEGDQIGEDVPEVASEAGGDDGRAQVTNTENKAQKDASEEAGSEDIPNDKAVKAAITKFNAFKKASEAVNNPMLDTLIRRVEKQLGKITMSTPGINGPKNDGMN